MGENVLAVKTINEIMGESFIIPSYQRGYRWTKTEVQALLDDIYTFGKKNNNDKSYCLQPVVVLPHKDGNKTKWVVLDGQQRLTTISIILSYLDFDEDIFTLSYNTRDGSESFLTDIKHSTKINDTNIDYLFMSKAFFTIKEWFDTKKEQKEHTAKHNMISYLGDRVLIIWYEINESTYDPINIFTRLNIGKIALTNAELIKAKLLNSENFKLFENGDLYREQKELQEKYIFQKKHQIAYEWDTIEKELHNNELWGFLTDNTSQDSNRIEFIFNLLFTIHTGKDPKDYDVFLHIDDRLNTAPKDDEDPVLLIWQDVKDCFYRLQEWYNSSETFHYIGFILTAGICAIDEIYKESINRKKSEFLSYLNKKIRSRFLNKIVIDELSYGSDDKKIKNLLLLYNILSILNKKDELERISFYRYWDQKWTLEHIHAQNSEELQTYTQRKNWLEDHKRLLLKSEKLSSDDPLFEEIDGLTTKAKIEIQEFDHIHKKVVSSFVQEEDFDNHIDIHSIENLALLDSESNSSLSNSVFALKRDILLERDKAGSYILPATKNIFLKYYTETPEHLSYWTDKDKDQYIAHINNTIDLFFPNVWKGGQN